MSVVRDLPPVAGSIIWARQIDNQLTMYLKRVEDVLGKGWESHIEGQKLKADGDSFRAKLSTTEVFQDWARKVQERNFGISGGRIFTIDAARYELNAESNFKTNHFLNFDCSICRSRTGRGNILRLRVNFLPEIITLYKEVRNLKSLGFR